MDLDTWKTGTLVSCLVTCPISWVLSSLRCRRMVHREIEESHSSLGAPPCPLITRAGAEKAVARLAQKAEGAAGRP